MTRGELTAIWERSEDEVACVVGVVSLEDYRAVAADRDALLVEVTRLRGLLARGRCECGAEYR